MFARKFNEILSHTGFVLIRKGTLTQLISTQQWQQELCELKLEIKHLKEAEGRKFQEFEEAEARKFEAMLRHQISTKWAIIDAGERGRENSSALNCPLCDFHGETRQFATFKSNCIFEGGQLLRHQCPECDLIFGDNKMLVLSEAELATEYEWHYKAFSEADATLHEIRAFHALNPAKDGFYLNWGAGAWSKSIEVLRQEGWNVYGYEPHLSALSGNPYIISSKKQLCELRFDGIFSNNVLEHLRYPVRELASMSELLRPKGKMSHATSCFEYLYEYTRFHLFFFLGRSRSILASKANLLIDDFVVDGEFMDLVLSKN